jgi:adenylate kinase
MNLIFLGPQGSGKSTQAKMLASTLNLPYIEMGQIFRDKAAKDDSETARQIKIALDAGELVKDNIAVETLKERLIDPMFSNGFILDGYPRNQAQLEGLDKNIDKVFYIKVSDQEAIKRLSLRARDDDTQEALARRLEIYHEKTEPLLELFRQKNILEEIDGQKSIQDVNKEVLEKAK